MFIEPIYFLSYWPASKHEGTKKCVTPIVSSWLSVVTMESCHDGIPESGRSIAEAAWQEHARCGMEKEWSQMSLRRFPTNDLRPRLCVWEVQVSKSDCSFVRFRIEWRLSFRSIFGESQGIRGSCVLIQGLEDPGFHLEQYATVREGIKTVTIRQTFSSMGMSKLKPRYGDCR